MGILWSIYRYLVWECTVHLWVQVICVVVYSTKAYTGNCSYTEAFSTYIPRLPWTGPQNRVLSVSVHTLFGPLDLNLHWLQFPDSRTRQTISAMLSSNYVASTHNTTHSPCTSTSTMHPALPSSLPSTTLLCTQQTQSIVGKMAQDVGMVWKYRGVVPI